MSEVAALTDDSQLHYTQEARKKLIDQFMIDGKYPDDPKLLTILLSALKDIDRVTLTVKRINADNDNADADRQALLQFHKLSNMAGSKDYFRRDEDMDDDASRDPEGFNPEDIPTVPLVEGELHQGVDSIDYEAFMSKQDKIHKDSLA